MTLLALCLYIDAAAFLIAEPTSAQIQEAIGEAVNNIVKHFHKPEKEASDRCHSEFLCLIMKKLVCYQLHFLSTLCVESVLSVSVH